MTRWLAALPLVLLGGLSLVFGLSSLGHDPKVEPNALVGHPLPDLMIPELGSQVPQSLRLIGAGKPRLVNVFASWCPPCVVEQPALTALRQEGVIIIGIAYKDRREATQAFLIQYGDPYAVTLTDLSGRMAINLGVTGPPETYLVDAEGIVRAKHVGALSIDDGRALMAQALTKP